MTLIAPTSKAVVLASAGAPGKSPIWLSLGSVFAGFSEGVSVSSKLADSVSHRNACLRFVSVTTSTAPRASSGGAASASCRGSPSSRWRCRCRACRDLRGSRAPSSPLDDQGPRVGLASGDRTRIAHRVVDERRRPREGGEVGKVLLVERGEAGDVRLWLSEVQRVGQSGRGLDELLGEERARRAVVLVALVVLHEDVAAVSSRAIGASEPHCSNPFWIGSSIAEGVGGRDGPHHLLLAGDEGPRQVGGLGGVDCVPPPVGGEVVPGDATRVLLCVLFRWAICSSP